MQENKASTLLTKRFGIDVFSAASAAFAVSPFITIVDRSIIENASGRNKLSSALKRGFVELFTRPHRFVRTPAFLLVFGVYFTTYTTANIIDTVCSHANVDNQTPKFLGTTIANMTTCIYKDRAFTRMFGIVAPKGLPFGTYGLFATRDALTIAASFNLPSVMARELTDRKIIVDYEKSQNFAQMFCPAAVQIISCALHLYGLDLYNRPGVSLGSRLSLLKMTYPKTTITRIARIGPAFGIGGVGNRVVKERLSELVVDRQQVGVVATAFK
ncbi:putative membrane protein [Gigaspora margarita]|uniref:Putative membrane protein n=1 Tax=Gigaspora margarita TaxID=4874 RepID=A0A8H4B4B5_GIGMA|nr:putative membrane protein [Gigaspora margarita]